MLRLPRSRHRPWASRAPSGWTGRGRRRLTRPSPSHCHATGTRCAFEQVDRNTEGVRRRSTRAEIRVRAGGVDQRYPGRLAVRVEGGRLQLVNHVGMPSTTWRASSRASTGSPRSRGSKRRPCSRGPTPRAPPSAAPDYDLDDHQGAQVYRGRGRRHGHLAARGPGRPRGQVSDLPRRTSPRPPTRRRRAATRPTTSRSGTAPPSPTSVASPTPTTPTRRTTSGARRRSRDAVHARALPAVRRARASGSRSRERSAKGRVVRVRLSAGGPRGLGRRVPLRPSTPPLVRGRSGARASTSHADGDRLRVRRAAASGTASG